MTDPVLQNRNGVAVVQHRLSYNGSINTSSSEGSEMTIKSRHRPFDNNERRSRPARTLPLVALVGVALLAAGCASGSSSAPQRTSTALASAGTITPLATATATDPGESSTPPATTPTTNPGMSNTGTGPMIRPGTKAGNGSGGNETTGSYSVAFAECMRAHGVPTFPNPSGGGIGPDSGVNPTSPEFQAALHGPCQSLAPAGWLSSGPVTK